MSVDIHLPILIASFSSRMLFVLASASLVVVRMALFLNQVSFVLFIRIHPVSSNLDTDYQRRSLCHIPSSACDFLFVIVGWVSPLSLRRLWDIPSFSFQGMGLELSPCIMTRHKPLPHRHKSSQHDSEGLRKVPEQKHRHPSKRLSLLRCPESLHLHCEKLYTYRSLSICNICTYDMLLCLDCVIGSRMQFKSGGSYFFSVQ